MSHLNFKKFAMGAEQRRFYWLAFRRIGGPYVLLSAFWIIGSDNLVDRLPFGTHLELNLVKGIAFVVLTSVFITALGGRLLQGNARSEVERRREMSARLADYNALPGPVFTLDREGAVLTWNQRLLDVTGLQPSEIAGQACEALVAAPDRDAVRAAFAESVKNGTIQTVPARLVTADGELLEYLWGGAPVFDDDGAVCGVAGFGVDHSTEAREHKAAIKHLEQIETVLSQTIHVVGAAMEARDAYTAGHQTRVAQLAVAIAERLGLTRERIKGLRLACEVHDIGKLAVPADLLAMPRLLTGPEQVVVRSHVDWGVRILRDVAFPWPIATIVGQHHERMDGSGYPHGLKGDEILVESRIAAVADVVEAISTRRPYRAALGLDAAIEELRRGRGTHFDGIVVDACLALLQEGFVFREAEPFAARSLTPVARARDPR